MAKFAFSVAALVLCSMLLSCSVAPTLASRGVVRRQLTATSLACPATPLANCSFYFVAATATTIKTVNLTGVGNDKNVTGPIKLSVNPPANVTTGVNSGTPVFLSPTSPPGTAADGSNSKFANVFYMNGNQLQVRTSNVNITQLKGACVLLPITSAQIQVGTKNENMADLNTTTLPTAKRCVVFKVTV